MTSWKDRLAEAEKEFGTGGSGKSSWLNKFELGDTRVRLLTELEALPQHYRLGGYSGICIGKDEGCPGCAENDAAKELPTEEERKRAANRVSIKWLGLVIHYVQDPDTKELVGFVKPALLPHTVAQQIAMYQQDPEWGFESAPMPYGITIHKESTGPEKQNVEYTVKPSPNKTPIPEDLMKEFEKHNTPTQIKEAMKNKKLKELGLYSDEHAANTGAPDYPESINPEDIPF